MTCKEAGHMQKGGREVQITASPEWLPCGTWPATHWVPACFSRPVLAGQPPLNHPSRDPPGGPLGKNPPSMQGMQVRSLVGELRSQVPWGTKPVHPN